MKTYTLRRRQTLARPVDDVFKFFEKPENLEEITPGSVHFRILTPRPIKMKVGTILDYTIRLLGIPVRWTTLISDYEPPHRFADVALRGPYAFWHHTHTFEKHGNGTIMTDEIHYALPFGSLGRLVRFMWVKRQLDQIFDYRARIIQELLECSNPVESEKESVPDDSKGTIS